MKQLAVLPPNYYNPDDLEFIIPRVVELSYTARDMELLALDLGYEGEPFRWNASRRANITAELDAYYAHLYGLTRDELRYILDPTDMYGEKCPSETFSVLKRRELREFGEYRTQRLVLAAYDELAKSDRFAGEKRESAIEAPKGRSMVSVGSWEKNDGNSGAAG